MRAAGRRWPEKPFAQPRGQAQRAASMSRGFRPAMHPPTLVLPNMPIAVGSKAPDFTLKSKTSTGLVDVKLSDNFGKQQTVILFFPLAYTGVCTQEMCDQTSGLGEYEKLGASVLAISVDSPFAQEAWANTNKIGIKLASDLNKTVIKAYDVVFPMLAGVGDTAARAAFVIGKDGVVKYAEQTATPKDLPNFAAIKAALAK
jgi:peroxiredoxin